MDKELRKQETGEKSKGSQHDVFLIAREDLRVSGVRDVVAFDESCILLDTALGRLHVKGEGLKVKSLNETAEELVLEGKIDSLAYAGGGKQSGSVFRRIFQ